MIKIKSLTKTFKSKYKQITKALDNVSFDLPDNGFVFIIGKSGSGKTTLLNMIGGVDSFDSGEIEVNGIKLSKLKKANFDYYRNETIGFIFQDYQLLDELTVYQNVKLDLYFLNDKEYSKIDEALKLVGLNGYESRFPKELSGGEKQRVAIARAIIKNPAIILADEPTGNLDSINTKHILNILKEISKTKLVLIVSHNIFDAHEFADYILNLQDGKIISSYKRNENNSRTIEYKNGDLRLPLHKNIVEKDKEILIENLDINLNNIYQDDLDFVEFKYKNKETKTENKINKKHISFKNATKHGFYFIKRSLLLMISFSFIVGSLFGVVNSCEATNDINFERNNIEAIQNYDGKAIAFQGNIGQYNSYEKTKFISDEDVNKIKYSNYKGKIYEGFYRYKNTSLSSNDWAPSYHPRDFMIVDNDYFKNIGEEFKLDCEATKLEKYGVYFTDFTIDVFNTMNKSNAGEYESFLGKNIYLEYYLNGIIDTGYHEKYPEIYRLIKKYGNDLEIKEELNKLDKKTLYNFYNECGLFYNNSYSFEQNFFDYFYHGIEDNKVIPEYVSLDYKDKTIFFNPNSNTNLVNLSVGLKHPTSISKLAYTSLTGKTINETKGYLDIEPIKIEINHYVPSAGEHLFYKKDYITFDKVACGATYVDIFINVDENPDLLNIFKIRTKIVLDDTSNLNELIDNHVISKNLALDNYILGIESNARKLSRGFNKIFKLIIGILLASIVIVLVFFSSYLIKKNMRNIGILKSLGARSIDILLTLSINLILTLIITIALYGGLSYLFLKIIEAILLHSIRDGS